MQPGDFLPKRRFPVRLLDFLFFATDGKCGLELRCKEPDAACVWWFSSNPTPRKLCGTGFLRRIMQHSRSRSVYSPTAPNVLHQPPTAGGKLGQHGSLGAGAAPAKRAARRKQEA